MLYFTFFSLRGARIEQFNLINAILGFFPEKKTKSLGLREKFISKKLYLFTQFIK